MIRKRKDFKIKRRLDMRKNITKITLGTMIAATVIISNTALVNADFSSEYWEMVDKAETVRANQRPTSQEREIETVYANKRPSTTTTSTTTTTSMKSTKPANTTTTTTTTTATENTQQSTTAAPTNPSTTTPQTGSVQATDKIPTEDAGTRNSNVYINVDKCYEIINQYRKDVGASALTRDPYLEKLAQIRAKELVTLFSHTRPNGESATDIIEYRGARGENIAQGQRTCEEAMTSWYNSSGHRKNMLNVYYKKVGIAAYKVNGKIRWVQLFTS